MKWQARRDLAVRNASRALYWLEVSRRIQTDDGEAEFLAARACRRLGRFEQVRTHLKRAFELKFPVVQLEHEQWLALAQAGQLRDAEPHLSALLTDPREDGREICEAFVNGYFVNHRIKDAIGLIGPWISDYPQDPRAYFIRGRIYGIRQQYKPAVEDLRKSLELDPANMECVCEIGDMLVALHKPEEAVSFYERAAGEPAWKSRALIGQAKCHRLLGSPDRSREILDRVISGDERLFDAFLERGRLELESRNFVEAAEFLRQAAARAPNSVEVNYALASALRGAGNAGAQELYAFVAKAQGELAEAAKMADSVAENPHDAESRFRIGTIYLKYSMDEKGIHWLQSALNENPNHQKAHAALADYYEARIQNNESFAELARRHRMEAANRPGDAGT